MGVGGGSLSALTAVLGNQMKKNVGGAMRGMVGQTAPGQFYQDARGQGILPALGNFAKQNTAPGRMWGAATQQPQGMTPQQGMAPELGWADEYQRRMEEQYGVGPSGQSQPSTAGTLERMLRAARSGQGGGRPLTPYTGPSQHRYDNRYDFSIGMR